MLTANEPTIERTRAGRAVGPGHRSLEERFWSKVEKRGEDECWDWLGTHNGMGYGRLQGRDGRMQYAHRISWDLANGQPFPAELDCLHRCDRPSCVNPRHLAPGTAKDNAADMVAKGRHWVHQHPERIPRGERHSSRTHPERVPRGEAHGRALVTADDVRKMRRRFAAGESNVSIARDFGLTKSAVRLIRIGRNWRHVE